MLFPDFVVYFARSRRTDSGKLIDGALGGAAALTPPVRVPAEASGKEVSFHIRNLQSQVSSSTCSRYLCYLPTYHHLPHPSVFCC